MRHHRSELLGFLSMHIFLWMSLDAKLNCICDCLAKRAVDKGVSSPQRRVKGFPREAICVWLHGMKLISDVGPSLRFHAGRVSAKKYYMDNHIFTKVAFEEVDCESFHRTLDKRPKMFQIWLTKQAVGWRATGGFLSKFMSAVNECPNCGCRNKDSTHLNVCFDEERSKFYASSVASLEHWMWENHMHPDLAEVVLAYVRGRSITTFEEAAGWCSELWPLAQSQDSLGQHFMDGKISRKFNGHICWVQIQIYGLQHG